MKKTLCPCYQRDAFLREISCFFEPHNFAVKIDGFGFVVSLVLASDFSSSSVRWDLSSADGSVVPLVLASDFYFVFRLFGFVFRRIRLALIRRISTSLSTGRTRTPIL
jgi:hypothetical protein